MSIATGRGDDGSTGLLFGGDRVRKDDPRTEAYGTVDEAVAALGVARAELAGTGGEAAGRLAELAVLVLHLQRELFVVGAELATNPDARDRQRDGVTRVSREMVHGLGAVLTDFEATAEPPREFVVPGETRASAALEVARTVVRRAERRTVALAAADEAVADSQVIPYLNRLADLLWILARIAEQAENRTVTPARTGDVRGWPSTSPAASISTERSVP